MELGVYTLYAYYNTFSSDSFFRLVPDAGSYIALLSSGTTGAQPVDIPVLLAPPLTSRLEKPELMNRLLLADGCLELSLHIIICGCASFVRMGCCGCMHASDSQGGPDKEGSVCVAQGFACGTR